MRLFIPMPWLLPLKFYIPLFLSALFHILKHQHLCKSCCNNNFKSIRVLMKTGFTQTLSYAPSHLVSGAWVGNFRKGGCPCHPAGKISMPFLTCIHFSHRLGTYSRVNFPTCSRLFSPLWASQSQAIVPVDCHFNRIGNLHPGCTWSQILCSVKIPWSRVRKDASPK